MDKKIAKLQVVTDTAEENMKRSRKEFEEASERLSKAKDRLRSLRAEEQANMQVNDTELPELIDLHARAKEEYEMWKGRYETNENYLSIFKGKAKELDSFHSLGKHDVP